jgi:hypothetical protein
MRICRNAPRSTRARALLVEVGVNFTLHGADLEQGCPFDRALRHPRPDACRRGPVRCDGIRRQAPHRRDWRALWGQTAEPIRLSPVCGSKPTPHQLKPCPCEMICETVSDYLRCDLIAAWVD